ASTLLRTCTETWNKTHAGPLLTYGIPTKGSDGQPLNSGNIPDPLAAALLEIANYASTSPGAPDVSYFGDPNHPTIAVNTGPLLPARIVGAPKVVPHATTTGLSTTTG